MRTLINPATKSLANLHTDRQPRRRRSKTGPTSKVMHFNRTGGAEALESVMCDVIKIRLKIRIVGGKGNQLLNIKTAVERPISKVGLPRSFYITLPYVASLLFKRNFMTSYMTLSNTSWSGCRQSLTSYRVDALILGIKFFYYKKCSYSITRCYVFEFLS